MSQIVPVRTRNLSASKDLDQELSTCDEKIKEELELRDSFRAAVLLRFKIKGFIF